MTIRSIINHNFLTKNCYSNCQIVHSASFFFTATCGDNTGFNDSRQCLKETTSTLAPDVANTGNHLDVPRPGDNPNLLSPEILNQRRGIYIVSSAFFSHFSLQKLEPLS